MHEHPQPPARARAGTLTGSLTGAALGAFGLWAMAGLMGAGVSHAPPYTLADQVTNLVTGALLGAVGGGVAASLLRRRRSRRADP